MPHTHISTKERSPLNNERNMTQPHVTRTHSRLGRDDIAPETVGRLHQVAQGVTCPYIRASLLPAFSCLPGVSARSHQGPAESSRGRADQQLSSAATPILRSLVRTFQSRAASGLEIPWRITHHSPPLLRLRRYDPGCAFLARGTGGRKKLRALALRAAADQEPRYPPSHAWLALHDIHAALGTGKRAAIGGEAGTLFISSHRAHPQGDPPSPVLILAITRAGAPPPTPPPVWQLTRPAHGAGQSSGPARPERGARVASRILISTVLRASPRPIPPRTDQRSVRRWRRGGAHARTREGELNAGPSTASQQQPRHLWAPCILSVHLALSERLAQTRPRTARPVPAPPVPSLSPPPGHGCEPHGGVLLILRTRQAETRSPTARICYPQLWPPDLLNCHHSRHRNPAYRAPGRSSSARAAHAPAVTGRRGEFHLVSLSQSPHLSRAR